jgi:hypothetical protein
MTFIMHLHKSISLSPKPFWMVRNEIGLEVNADKTKYMVMSRDQKGGWIYNIKINNSSFERA